MRGLLCMAALVALPGAAFAQSQDTGLGRIEISGEAPSACLISAAPTSGGTNAAFVASTQSSAEVRITNMVDPLTAQAQAATVDLALPVICNTSHRVVIRAANGGLARIGAPQPAPGFRELVPYNVTATWAGVSDTGSSQDAPAVDIVTGDGAAGSLSVNIDIPAGGDPLVAGDYADELIIELQVAG